MDDNLDFDATDDCIRYGWSSLINVNQKLRQPINLCFYDQITKMDKHTHISRQGLS